MSPFAKEELYQLYLKGTTVKDLSLKYGILPQRVKAIVFQKHLYWTEVYPKMGETHMRLALEREAIYAMDFPFVDYGIDIQIMSQMEAGVELRKVKRSEADARPPKELEEKIEKSLTKVKSRRSDMIPIGFIGKAGKGYVLKEYVRHRGLGSPMVNKDFKDAVRLMGTDREHHLSKFKKLRMQEGGPRLKAAWLLKCKALTKKAWIDDLEIDEEGVADILMDDNAMNNAPRPGTSFSRPLSSVGQPGGISQMVRPMSNAGRPISGYQRPGTNRPVSGMSRGNLSTALQGQRPGTSRPVTSGGRLLRLGTASMLQQGGQFIMADKLNAKNVAKKKHIAKAVVDYLIYVESNFRRALDIAAEATQMVNYNDWWWKARIGKCQFKMGMIKDSEKQFLSSLKTQDMITTHIEVAKVSIRLDQPLKAIEMFNQGLKSHPFETHLVIGIARIHDLLNDMPKSTSQYKNVLSYDNQNIEAIASLASYHFYTDQPEVALRFYRRLVQCGVHNSELWNNMGLCCFYASQYDMALSCFDKALSLSDDSNVADVWYNIGHVAIGIGDLGLAYQSFKIAVSNNPNHAESFNNLGVLELRKGNVEQSKSNFLQSARIANFLFEPSYNAALLSLKKGEFQESYTLVQQALQIFPDHADSKELLKNLNQHFSIM